MLSTRDRRLLLDALRPPTGYQLDRGIGSTFSLDLLALLTAPLAFTFFDWEDEDAEFKADPIALLDALRRYASRIHLFCQAGRISLPKPEQSLLAYLEDSVIEVTAPQIGALFHPKLWVLRFTGADGEPVRYRVICSSRNLTFERCWDTALVLDGELIERRQAFAQNHPLADFVSELPRLALKRGVPTAAAETVSVMEEELRRVRFALPEGFSEMSFVPIGLGRSGGKSSSPLSPHSGRLLVVSPFLSGDLLEELASENDIDAVVSTPEALDALTDEAFERIGMAFVLSPEAEIEARDASSESASAVGAALRGLHTKLYVMDDGWDSRVWTGSANATVNGFHRNVELLVQLVGRRKDCGIDAVLGSADPGEHRRDAFRSLLRPYAREARQPLDVEREALEKRLDALRLQVACLGLRFLVEGGQEEGYSLVLQRPAHVDMPTTVATIEVWPASLRAEVMLPLVASATGTPRWSGLSFEAITSFCAVEIVLPGREEETAATRFVLNLPLDGAPPDRRDRLLQSILKDRRQLIRLLLLLLSEEGLTPTELLDQPTAGVGKFGRWLGDSGEGLLEALLLALEQNPRRLDDVARLLGELQATLGGRELLPEGLAEVWEPIWQARGEGGP